jgi:phospholipid/cholesterol/gamma-HCH transport system substrate-binding protein
MWPSRIMAGEDSTAARSRQRRRVLAGTLLLVALIAGSLLTFFLDVLLERFERTYTIHAVLPGATGLAAESAVWLSGREVGRVSSVGLMPSGADSLARVIVDLRMPLNVQSHVRRDSEVRVTSIGPMSDKVLDISAGTAGSAVLSPGDTLRSAPQTTAMQLAQRSAAIKVSLDTVVAELMSFGPAIRARLEQTERSFAGLDAVMVEADRLQADIAANPGLALLQDPSFAAALDGTRRHAAELPVMIRRLGDSAGPAGEVRAAIARLQLRADSLNTQLTAAVTALDNPNGTLSRMQQDTAITRAINDARAELDSLMADMRRNPLRYVF